VEFRCCFQILDPTLAFPRIFLPLLSHTHTYTYTTMASGERLTVTYANHPSGPLKVDVYCTVPPVSSVDPTPNLDQLPFLLYLHGGHFLTSSRRDVPPWLVSLARSLGTPLLCPDLRLAPHAGPLDAYNDVEQLWSFIQDRLPWMIACR
jgi:acetyl esterase/lipase